MGQSAIDTPTDDIDLLPGQRQAFCAAPVNAFSPSSGSQMSKKGWMDMRDE